MSADYAILFKEGLDKNIFVEIPAWPSQYREFFNTETTDSRVYDVQQWQSYGYLQPREPGESLHYDQFLPSFNKRFIIQNFSLADAIPEEDVDDDIYGIIQKFIPSRSGGSAQSVVDTYEQIHANFISVYGFSASTAIPGMTDGFSLFNLNHPTSASIATPQANTPSSGEDLSFTSLKDACTNIRTQVAPNGITPMMNAPATLGINPQESFIAEQLLRGNWERGTGDRNLNVLFKNIKIVEWPYLHINGVTGTNNGWFLLGKRHYLRTIIRKYLDVKTDYSFNVNSYMYAVICRFDYGAEDWRGSYGSPGN